MLGTVQTQTTTLAWVQRSYKLKNWSGRTTECKEGSRDTGLDGEGKAGMWPSLEKEASGEKMTRFISEKYTGKLSLPENNIALAIYTLANTEFQ